MLNNEEDLTEFEKSMLTRKTEKANRTVVFTTLDELLNEKIPPKEYMVGDWLERKSINMVFAKTGVGKTIFCLTMALCMAAGRECFGWEVPKPRRILYLDGEMPLDHLQRTVKRLMKGMDIEREGLPFTFMTCDKQRVGGVKVNERSVASVIQQYIMDNRVEMLIVDNVSTLMSSEYSENDAQSWDATQQWALDMRKAGATVLFVHHAGKGGDQRGTSKREDALDTSIKLERLDNDEPGFRLVWQKFRREAPPREIEVSWVSEDAYLKPVYSAAKDNKNMVWECWEMGMNVADIMAEIGVTKKTVYKWLGVLKDEGKLRRPFKSATF